MLALCESVECSQALVVLVVRWNRGCHIKLPEVFVVELGLHFVLPRSRCLKMRTGGVCVKQRRRFGRSGVQPKTL